jgi:TIR domain/Papain family cysteine protease
MANIFINYRRADSITVAFILYNKLLEKKHTVFIDKEAIPIGFDFADYIKKKIKVYDVMLTLIGNQWLTLTDSKKRIRIKNEDDHVRLELAEALQSKTIKIIPVLIDKVQMPGTKDLTTDLKELTKLNAIYFFSYEYDKSADRVLVEIERMLNLLTSKDLSRFIKITSIKDDRIVTHALKTAMEANLLVAAGITAMIDFDALDSNILYVSKLKKGQGAYILSGLYAAEQFGVQFNSWKVKAVGNSAGININDEAAKRLKSNAAVVSGSLKRYPVDSIDDMIRHLNANRPVIAAIMVYESFRNNKTGGMILSPFSNTDSAVGGHVIIITHIDLVKDRIKFANLWGKEWGDKGFGYFSEASFDSCTSWDNIFAIETVYNF